MAMLWALGLAYVFFVLAMGIAKWHAAWGFAHLGDKAVVPAEPSVTPDWEG